MLLLKHGHYGETAGDVEGIRTIRIMPMPQTIAPITSGVQPSHGSWSIEPLLDETAPPERPGYAGPKCLPWLIPNVELAW